MSKITYIHTKSSKHEISVLLSYRKSSFVVKPCLIHRPGSPIPSTIWERDGCALETGKTVLGLIIFPCGKSSLQRWRNLRFKSWYQHLVSVSLWASCLTSLSLSSLICKTGIKISNSQSYCDRHIIISGDFYNAYFHLSYMAAILGNLRRWK